MSGRLVTVTGGSGFVGQMLRSGLRGRGYRLQVFDRYRGPAIDLLRRPHLATSTSRLGLTTARRLRRIQPRIEHRLTRAGLIRPTTDDILDLRSSLAEHLRGSSVVIHLAGLPHPHMPGATDTDFQRINYDGSVNVFEAARLAGVPRFIFASSGQVYGINNPVRIDLFPILETNYCPTLKEGQSMYGWLKLEFEKYLAQACSTGSTQAIALRLEYPGIRSTTPNNFYVSTSIENLVAGFASALEAPVDFAFETFNLVDGEVDREIVDIQDFVRRRWPDVPNHTGDNESLVSTAKARDLLGYRPTRGGSYIPSSLAWRSASRRPTRRIGKA